jgi:uncharacterized repeat protein (TIGR02543 family)
MIAKKLLTTIAFAFVLLLSGCANDDFDEIDGLCPVVTTTNPDDLATDVPLNQVISAKFNEKINPTTISGASFTVAVDGTLIDGTVSQTDSTAIFTPSSLLDVNTEYTATIKTLVKDQRGNALQEDYVWTFTTVPPLPQFTVVVLSSPADGGVTDGGGSFSEGTSVTVTATENPLYTFVNWTDNGTEVSTNANYEFVLIADITLVANYSLVPPTQFALNLSSNPALGGVTSASGAGPYDAGTSVTVTATADSALYEFTSWSGDATGTANPLTVTMDSDKDITANFILIGTGFTLNLNAVNGTVLADPIKTTYNDGDIVILTPEADPNYVFDSWSGDATGNNDPLTVTMDADKNITASFLLAAATGSYPAGVNLRSAADFAILGGSGVSNTGVSTMIIGDVGSFPTATINGLLPANVNGTLYTSADPIVGLAKDDLTTAYNDAQSRSTDAISLPGQLGGLTLAPGLYVNSSTSGISGTGTNGILTLDAGGDANAVWIFKMGSTLITDGDTSIVLAGNADPANIYWSVGTSATLGTNSIFFGNILADQAITLTTGATLTGRALTRIAEVTLDTNTVTKP